MSLEIRQFPCLSDNYGFLLRDPASGLVAAIDAPDASRISLEVQAAGWGRLDLVLLTHWHPDHTGGAAELKALWGAEIVGPAEVERVVAPDRTVDEGDRVTLGETGFEVLELPGHTLGHIAFHHTAGANLFSGDVLFALGCGRLFEGTPAQMFASLQRLAALPDATTIWCAHEYTETNARFALTLDDSPALAAHAEAIFAARARGEPTVPTSLAIERRFNPFLTAADVEAFTARREARNGFR
ncbi:MAG: hydroxyacylglutathione hydrolase [Brevundimonas sp.]|uniref:hydroxyacylglutathione hydrolase n=1 Tax=Brevundimonas sp. TaxID=1871086 RepID=UPI0022C01061|nr:hydroxyacylglutathione hydrolase [Brevundimonas sp.]MCZ8194850.1 hydroxyacylglutathione hydrolase [Brevundimonas sp.]